MNDPGELVRYLVDKLIGCYEARLSEREQLGRFWARESLAPAAEPEVNERLAEHGRALVQAMSGSLMAQQGSGEVPLGVLAGDAPVPETPGPGAHGPLMFRLLMNAEGYYEPHQFRDCKGPLIGCLPLHLVGVTGVNTWVQIEQVHPDDRAAVEEAMRAHPGHGQYEFADERSAAEEADIPF